jgi:hypothetical protein
VPVLIALGAAALLVARRQPARPTPVQ